MRIPGYFIFLCSLIAASATQAKVRIEVDLASQTMHVEADEGAYDWRVSTARSGYATPRGHYRSGRLERMHYSHKYHMSPMPHAIFFAGGYAIHGTYETAHLGRPASHGCIRISPADAAFLYGLVKTQGADIRIHGSPPRPTYAARSGWEKQTASRRHERFVENAYDWRAEALAHVPARRVEPVIRRGSWENWPE